ncbi:MAG: flagellar motor switch protein FliM [Bryobacterales bacterium]|nr:flagellar motor switch protein FliM [Bryobacteraceae bacterium]MDW8354470.1 flagellar motor switch protein FliM [Bryobacterales bacterium]
MSRELTQQEIDVFQSQRGKQAREPRVVPFDLRWLDRIPKSQLRSIRLLHEGFARNLASSLSAYLRAYVTINLVSVEQLSYADFQEGLSSPSCLVALRLKPYDGRAVLEITPNLAFAVLEILLGGKAHASESPSREMTDIEESLLEGLLRIILQDLRQAWASVVEVDFVFDSIESEPQFLPTVDPREAFVVIAAEVRLGDLSGMMTLGIPSLVIKMMRTHFEHHWSLQRGREANSAEQALMLERLRRAELEAEVRLRGPELPLRELLALEEGDLLSLDVPLGRPLECRLSDVPKFHGRVAAAGSRRVFVIDEVLRK